MFNVDERDSCVLLKDIGESLLSVKEKIESSLMHKNFPSKDSFKCIETKKDIGRQ